MEYINRLRYKGTIPTLATSNGLVNQAVYDDMGIVGDPEPPTPSATTYTLTLIQTSGGTITAPKLTGYTSGESVTVTATPDSGYEIAQWNLVSGGGYSESGNTMTTTFYDEDITVSCTFQAAAPSSYNVTVVTPTGGTVTASPSGTVSAGTQVTFTATPIHSGQATSYNFDHWSITVGQTTSTGTTNPMTVTATGDVTCQAVFIKASLIQLWQTDGDGTTQYLSATGTFNGDTYTMRTYDGNVTNDISQFWPSGTSVTVEAHGSDIMSWSYNHWDDSGVLTNGDLSNPETFTLNGRQMTCQGGYDHPMPPEPETPKVSLHIMNSGTNGIVSITGTSDYESFSTAFTESGTFNIQVNDGSTLYYSATSNDPDTHFECLTVKDYDTIDQTYYQSSGSVSAYDGCYYEFIFMTDMPGPPMMEFTVTTSTNQPGNPDVEVSGGGTYMEFDNCTLTASTVDHNYEFMQWVDESTYQVLSMDNPYTFTVDQDYSIRADFRYNEPMPDPGDLPQSEMITINVNSTTSSQSVKNTITSTLSNNLDVEVTPTGQNGNWNWNITTSVGEGQEWSSMSDAIYHVTSWLENQGLMEDDDFTVSASQI